jgi:hypothetical protein
MTKVIIQTQLNRHKTIRRSFPVRSHFPATVFDPSTQTWKSVSPTAPSDSSCLSPRLVAAAATPPLKLPRSHLDSTQADYLEAVWKILTLLVLAALASTALICVILAFESTSPTTESRVEIFKTGLHKSSTDLDSD